MLISQLLLWACVIVLAVAVLALARQVGVLHERIAPVGALAISRGPQPGEAAPRISTETLAGGSLAIGGQQQPGRMQLLFFVAPTCPVCKNLLPTAKRFAETESLDLILIGDGDAEEHRQMARRYEVDQTKFVNSSEIGRAFHVGKLPHAVLVSELGIIVAQGLVNTREHLESLMVAHETGLRSVQEYLSARKNRQQNAEHQH
jgi:methylamine dehydrogenase accessory protein MauD